MTSGPQARKDARTAVIGVACSILLVVAALALERVCRVKPPGEDDTPAN